MLFTISLFVALGIGLVGATLLLREAERHPPPNDIDEGED